MDPGEFSRTVRVFLPFHVQLVSNMKKEIQSPIMDKQDLKAKAIAAAQSTCSAVVSYRATDSFQREWAAVRSARWRWE